VTVLWGGVGGQDQRQTTGLARYLQKRALSHLSFAGKKWSEWNAVWGRGFSIRAVRLVQGRLPFPLKKRVGMAHSQWDRFFQQSMQNIEQMTNNVTGIFQSFRLEWKKRSMSEDLHVFQKVSSIISFTIKIFQPKILAFLLTNGSLPWSYGHYRAFASQAILTRGRTHRICTGPLYFKMIQTT